MGIIHSCLEILSERIMLISLMNCLFFGAFFVGSLVLQTYSPLLKYPEYKEIKGYSCNGDGLNLFVYVFSNNLFLSSLLLVTLPGVVFFLFPSALLVWKAGLWGFLFAYLPSERFVAALPVIILEGEAYVLGGVAGTILGLSWLKPEWIAPTNLHRRASSAILNTEQLLGSGLCRIISRTGRLKRCCARLFLSGIL